MAGMAKEFREFALKGNMVDMAVGIVIGAAFGTVVSSFVDDILMPPLGLLIGDVDFQDLFVTLSAGAEPGPYPTLEAAQEAGAVTLNYGMFFNALVSFLIVALAIFLAIRAMNRMRRAQAEEPPPSPTDRECPFCASTISVKAVRCPFCTSEVEVTG